MAEREKDVKLNMDVKEAVRNISQVERQVDKLGDLADQGERLQDGFLSRKQVYTYRNLLREVERNYQDHYKSLQRMQEDYLKNKESAEKELEKRTKLYENAQGGNRWGDVASPAVLDYHERKYNEAHEKYNDTTKAESQLEQMREVVRQMGEERTRGQAHAGRIDNMHQANPMARDAMSAVGDIATSGGLIHSIDQLTNYVGDGINKVRDQDKQAYVVGQRLGTYEGDDTKVRTDARETGLENQYKTSETLQTQSILLSGGTEGDSKKLQADTEAVQNFSRAYTTDPDQLAQAGSYLKQVGALNDGDMQRFADLIGGAVAKNSMNGREEEMLRATTNLLARTSQGQVEFGNDQVEDVVALQATLGETNETLKGDKGADLLGRADDAIKSKDNALQILMGRGTNPEYQGPAGLEKLQMQMEKGISDPENLRTIFTNAKKFGYDDATVRDIIGSNLGWNKTETKELWDSGFVDKVANGELSDEEISKEMSKYGKEETKKRTEDYNKTNAKERLNNEAENESIKTKASYGFEEIGSGINTLWNSLPDAVQVAAPFAGGILGTGMVMSGMGRKIARKALKTVTPTIGGKNPKVPDPDGKPPSGDKPDADKKPDTDTEEKRKSPDTEEKKTRSERHNKPDKKPSTGERIKEGSKKAWEKTKGAGKTVAEKGSKILGPLGTFTALDMADDAGGAVGDWFWGHSAGEEKSGGFISNPFKDYGTYEEGRQGAFYKAIGIDSQIKDEKEEKKVDKDKKEEKEKKTEDKKEDGNKKAEKKVDEDSKKEEKKVAGSDTPSSPEGSTLDTLNVTNLYIQDKSLSDLLQSGRNPEKEAYRAIVESSGNDREVGKASEGKDKKGKANEMVIRVVVEGQVEGMTAENQGTIAGAIAGTFDSAVAGITNFITGDGYDLSQDQSRG
jgi:outer membrane biosynthesis protein TonB